MSFPTRRSSDLNLYPPYGEEIEKDLFTIDFEKLNYKEEQYVKSPYTQNNLPFIMNTDGEVFIDYRSDFMNIMDENDFTFKVNVDIRYIYYDVSNLDSVYSLSYK